MEDFKNYLISEFKEQAKGYAAVEFKFSHFTTLKSDKETKKLLHFDIIKVNMKFADKAMNILHAASIQFENNIIPKAKAKAFINISPKELEVKFGLAKKEICEDILRELKEKEKDITVKICNIHDYMGTKSIISKEFQGKVIKVEDEEIIPGSIKIKPEYDM